MNSMTGFGASSGQARGFKFRLEARSFNHRFLEIKTHLPEMLFGMETEIESLAREYFERGKIEIYLNIESTPEDFSFAWSRPIARAYIKVFEEMKKELGISGKLSLDLLVSQKDVIIAEPERWAKQCWSDLIPLFHNCFAELKKAREEEGQRLSQDLKKHIGRVRELSKLIWDRQDEALAEARSRLEKKVERLKGLGPELDEGRLEQEVVLMATRCDISEELERIRSHLKQFEKELAQEGAVGKKLEFLTQELHREFNTLSAKTQDPEISHFSVEARTELERLRQQLQNIE